MSCTFLPQEARPPRVRLDWLRRCAPEVLAQVYITLLTCQLKNPGNREKSWPQPYGWEGVNTCGIWRALILSAAAASRFGGARLRNLIMRCRASATLVFLAIGRPAWPALRPAGSAGLSPKTLAEEPLRSAQGNDGGRWLVGILILDLLVALFALELELHPAFSPSAPHSRITHYGCYSAKQRFAAKHESFLPLYTKVYTRVRGCQIGRAAARGFLRPPLIWRDACLTYVVGICKRSRDGGGHRPVLHMRIGGWQRRQSSQAIMRRFRALVDA